jgi:hypothetical protein
MSEARLIIATESGLCLRTAQDISDLIGAGYASSGLLLSEPDLSPEFFDLRTGLAGQAFQKFTNYRLRVALVIADPGAYGKRFSELAYEHRNHNLIRFFSSEAEAKAWLSL